MSASLTKPPRAGAAAAAMVLSSTLTITSLQGDGRRHTESTSCCEDERRTPRKLQAGQLVGILTIASLWGWGPVSDLLFCASGIALEHL